MRKPSLLVISALTCLGLSGSVGLGWDNQPVIAQAQPESTQAYALMGVSFDSPEPFSAPIAMPQSSVAVLYPATATPGNEDFKVSLRSLPPNDLISERLSEGEFSQWARIALQNPNRPPVGQIERTILGRRLIGDVSIGQSRRQTVSEMFVLSLTSGHRLLITFESTQQLPLSKLERFITTISSSMQEIPANSRAWRESFRIKAKK
jgi:hypothetical protein